MTTSRHTYGWKPDLPDHRDMAFLSVESDINRIIPSSVDLRDRMPPVYNQGQLGSCTANAIGGLFQYLQKQKSVPNYVPSRLFIYYEERNREGSIPYDSGAMIRDGMKVVSKIGAPPETDWTYDISKFASPPPTIAYADAARNRILQYAKVTRTGLKNALAQFSPVVVGISVYESFEQISSDGVGSMPHKQEKLLGGHAILLVGYNDVKRQWILRNSWGSGWGDDGYFTLPYPYLLSTHLSSDFWTATQVSS